MSTYVNEESWMSVFGREWKTNLVVIQVFLVVVLTGTAAFARPGNFRAKYAGAVTTTEIDIDANEEETARISTGVGMGTVIGPFVFHEVRESELLEPMHPENMCGAGQLELIDVHWTLVMTDQRGANQLFFRLAEDQPHMFCLDPNNLPMGGGLRIHELDIIGGSGRFDGAAGRVRVECTGRALAPGDPAGGPAHGAISCKLNGLLDY